MTIRPSIQSLLFLCLLLLMAPLLAQDADKSDTRILIDISGSMKENDPKNLRRSALRLIVGLMPPDNRAGVWTFAQYTNMLLPLGVVNDSWKKRARTISDKISSPGQFTNIEDVLKRSTADWKDAGEKYRRNVILLTDGMVDVSKDGSKNEASRKRILEEILPQIKASGAQVHTVALSERADHELMKQLSSATGGWYEQVNEAGELQRVFLRMFEKAAKPDAVPLQGNKFKLDESIDEATLLVFSKAGAPPSKIMSPDGKVFDANSVPGNATWHKDEGYDLVTISKPQAGEWTIEADMDPDNRVMVVTNLKMKTSDIPNRLAVGEAIPVSAYFTDKGQQITEKQFLDVVHVSAAQFFQGEEGEAMPLRDDGQSPDATAGDGKFNVLLGEGQGEGKLELIISADGKSFVRERRQSTEIVPPAKLEIEDDDKSPAAMFSIVLDTKVVKSDTVRVEAGMEDIKGGRTTLEFEQGGDGLLTATFDKKQALGRFMPAITVSGKTLSGNDFVFSPQADAVMGLAEPPPPPKQAELEPKPEPEPTPEPVVQPQPEPEPAPVEEEKEETDWVSIGIAVGVGNLLLILIGAGVWWFMRRESGDEEQLFDEEEAELEAHADESGGQQEQAEDAAAKDAAESPQEDLDIDADLEKENKSKTQDDATIDITAEEDK